MRNDQRNPARTSEKYLEFSAPWPRNLRPDPRSLGERQEATGTLCSTAEMNVWLGAIAKCSTESVKLCELSGEHLAAILIGVEHGPRDRPTAPKGVPKPGRPSLGGITVVRKDRLSQSQCDVSSLRKSVAKLDLLARAQSLIECTQVVQEHSSEACPGRSVLQYALGFPGPKPAKSNFVHRFGETLAQVHDTACNRRKSALESCD